MAKSTDITGTQSNHEEEVDVVVLEEKLLANEKPGKEVGDADSNEEDRVDLEDDNEGVPTDAGFSWVIVASCVLNSFVVMGHRRCLQALFVDITQEFEASTTMASLTFTFYSLLTSVSTLFTTNVLLSRFHARTICVVAAFVNAIITMLGSWSPNIVVWLICYGLKGIPFGALLVVPMSQIGHYFKKRRSLACSISSTGLVVANILFPPFAVFLREQYGFRWTMLLLGAIELHAIAPIMLLRPHSWFKKIYNQNRAKALKNLNGKSQSDSKDNGTERKQYSGRNLTPNSPYLERITGSSTTVDSIKHGDVHLQPRHRTASTNSAHILGASLPGSTLDIVPVGASGLNLDEEPTSDSYKNEKPLKKFCSLSTFVDTSLLKLWTCRMMMAFMSVSAFNNFILAYMPAIAFHAGISKADAAMLLTLAGCMDLVVRVTMGFLADKNFISKEKMVAASLIVIAILTQFSRYYTTYKLFVMFALLVGVFAGFRQNFFNSLCLDYFGAEKAPKALGLCAMCITLLMSLNHPVIGALADATGSFTASLHYVGCVVFLAVIIISFTPVFRRWDEENMKKQWESSGEEEEEGLALDLKPTNEKK